MMSPSVSVVIPTVGRESLYAAINSALESLEISLEVVVVTNNLRKPIDFSRISKNVNVYDGNQVLNGNQARNLGVQIAKSSVVAFLDDDDLFLPEKLKLQYTLLEGSGNNATLISSRYFQGPIAHQNVYPTRAIKKNEDVASYLLERKTLRNLHNSIPTSTWMGYREMFLNTRFDEDLTVHQDWDWLLRASKMQNLQIIQIQEPLLVYSISSSDATSKRTNWEDSMNWYYSHRELFSTEIRGSFLITNLHSRIVRSGDLKNAWWVLKNACKQEKPNFTSIVVAVIRHVFFFARKYLVKIK